MKIFNLLSDGLVISGACILIVALFPVRKLIRQLPAGKIRRRWYTLTGLISLFILGYFSYAVAFWGSHSTWLDLIVPAVFFFGAGFVWLSANLSLQTTTDIGRVTVLERENIIDPLTEVYNRRYLDRRLAEECALVRRHGLPLSALLIDIDHFKPINDAYGHQVGDLVLGYLGRLLQQAVRESDIIARYGGDELLIIAPNTPPSMAGALAERLREHVETHELVVTNIANKPQEIRFTVSIGVASLTDACLDCQSLVQNVDRALYRAKQEGRNRISVFEVSESVVASPAGG
jgi:diguanylate cyclase (GGDEF)-like protein